MPQGKDLISLARTKIGKPYVFGVLVPKDDPNYSGAYDCAEYAAWVIYQVTGKLVGCQNNSGNPHGQDAYSGYFARDVQDGTLIQVPIEKGINIPGCLLIRVAAGQLVGHVAFAEGNDKTVEANSTKYGTIESHISGRHWDYAALVRGVDYDEVSNNPVVPVSGRLYRMASPLMHDEFIKQIQKAVGLTGSDVDGWYGQKTTNAVRAFQLGHGLTPDGDAGENTLKALGL